MPQESILLTVIVPMRNEERYIKQCLKSILENDFPRDQYEILVVDGRSTDRSRQIVLETAAEHDGVRVLDNPGIIPPAAMNIGVQNARGRYIIRMDAHSEYPANYFRTCIEELERTGAENVGGSWITKPGAETAVAEAISLISQHPFGVGPARYRLGWSDRYVDTVPYGTFRRELFDRVGLFREDLRRMEDLEFNSRIRAAGGKIFLSSQIHNVYYNVPTFSRFMRQAFMNGAWHGRSWQKYPTSFSPRHAVPLAFVGGIVSLMLLGLLWPICAVAATTILAVYFLIAVSVGIQLTLQNGWKHFIIVPPLLFAYHSMFGIATVWGLVTRSARPRP